MKHSIHWVAAIVVAGAVGGVGIDDPFGQEWHEPAPGVHVGIRPDPHRTPVMGNTTVVIGERRVLVFDGGGVPLLAERTIAHIRALTDRPVTHVVVSHWHQDHSWGISAFADAYPGVQVLAHPYTRAQLERRNAASFPGLADNFDDQVAQLAARLDGELPPLQRARLERVLADAPAIGREYARIVPLNPSVDVDRRVVVDLGGRAVELLHLGAGNTAGDLVLWVPDVRVVATGDLVVHPTPFGFGSHPRAWAQTLRALAELDFAILVPGHGEIQRDRSYLSLLIATLDAVVERSAAFVDTVAEGTGAAALLDLTDFVTRYARGDASLAERFEAWFRRPIAQAAWREGAGLDPEVD